MRISPSITTDRDSANIGQDKFKLAKQGETGGHHTDCADIQFSKTLAVLKGMGLKLIKKPDAPAAAA